MEKDARDTLITEHMLRVEIVAREEYSRCMKRVPLKELISEGNEGLVEAARRFDPTRRVKFWTYAETRVRGRIRDSIRKSIRLDKNSKIRKTVNLKSEGDADTYNPIGEHEEKSNNEKFWEWLSKTKTLTSAEKILMELRYKEEMAISKLAKLVDSRPDELSKIFKIIQLKIKDGYRRDAAIEKGDYASKTVANKLAKERLSNNPPTKKKILESASKETDPIDKALEALDLFSFIWGNRPQDELLKEKLDAHEKRNKNFKKILDQLEEKGANRLEVVKLLAKNTTMSLEKHFLGLKKAAEKDRKKPGINPASLEYLFASAHTRKKQKALFDLLPGMNDEHLERIKNELNERGVDITKISPSKPQLRPAFTQIMVGLYNYLNPLCAYEPIHMEKIARKLVELYPGKLNLTPEEIRNT